MFKTKTNNTSKRLDKFNSEIMKNNKLNQINKSNNKNKNQTKWNY
jgi:hypothetical protein